MITSRPATTIAPTRVVFPEEDIATIQEAVAGILRSGQLVQGRHVRGLEEAFAAFVGSGHALATNSGTSALETIFRSLGIAGRDVLVPVNTFIATVAAVMHAGGRPVPADVDLQTGSLTLAEVERRTTAATAAVVIVHIGGLISASAVPIRDWCAARGLALVEDAAHAHGSRLRGMAAGTIGRAGGFSMFATKVMTTGEGGMVVTDDGEIAASVARLRDHGKIDTARNLHDVVGGNWRMSEIHAVLGRSQLARLPVFLERRSEVARWYDQALGDRQDLTLLRPAGPSSWYKYMLLLPEGADKPRLRAGMADRGVHLAGDVFEVPLHRQPVFRQWSSLSFPGAEAFARRHVCLPIHPLVTREDVDRVAGSLLEVLDDQAVRP